MMPCAERRRRVYEAWPQGYILLEVVVSMMMLTIGILAMLRSFSVATLARGLAQDYTDARYLAGERIWFAVAQSRAGMLETGSSGGGFADEQFSRFSWKQVVETTELPYYEPSALTAQAEAAMLRAMEESRGGRGRRGRRDTRRRDQPEMPTPEDMPEKFFARVVVTITWTRRGEEHLFSVATLVPPIEPSGEQGKHRQ